MESSTLKITFRDMSTQVVANVSSIREFGTYTILMSAGQQVLHVPSIDVMSIAVEDLPDRVPAPRSESAGRKKTVSAVSQPYI